MGGRDGVLKYVARQDGNRKQEYLFDLARDPGEKTDLMGERSADAARLRRLLRAWEQEVRPRR